METTRTDRAAAGRRLRDAEDGMALIHVGIAIVVLMALSSFVLDYGVLWLSRVHAQNSADAGALAGATARAFDETTDPPAADGAAYNSALSAAQSNSVFGAVPAVTVAWTCPGFVIGTGCVRVDVSNTTLPTFFAQIFGVGSQAIQATATAQARPANASDCMRPLAVEDRWAEAQTPPWDLSDTFDRYHMNGNRKGQLIANPDSYTAPTTDDPGTGFTVADNYGQQVTLKSGSNFSGGWFQPVDIPRADGASDTGGARYRDNLASCSGIAVSIGDYLALETGNMVGPTTQGISALIAQDPDATWDINTQSIDNTCAPACAPFSPRIIALPLFNPDEFQFDTSNTTWPNCPGGGSCVHVTNIIGFFVDHMDGNNVVGYLIRYPGVLTSKPGGVGGPSSFVQVISLVR